MKAVFPIFDEKIYHDHKTFIHFLLFISTCVITFYSFKISNLLNPDLYHTQSLNHFNFFLISLLIIIPLFLFIITQFTFVIAINIYINFPIVFTFKPLQVKHIIHEVKKYFKSQPVLIKHLMVMRC